MICLQHFRLLPGLPAAGVLLVTLLISTGCNKQTEFSFSAGAAAAPVNPPAGTYIAGDRQGRQFTGVHDSLFVKAVVISDSNEKIAVLTVDCIGLLKPEIDRIRQRVAAAGIMPADHIVLSSTHAHSGPYVVGIWGKDYTSSGVDTAYTGFLVRTAAEQIIRADHARVPVSMSSVSGMFMEEWFQNISDSELDRTVSVIRFSDAQGRSVATMTNFACHPTFMDATFSVVSADYPGYFYKAMDRRLGGVNLFLQGAIGGWVQPENGRPGFEGAQEAGFGLASFAQSLLDTARSDDSGKGIRFKTAPLNLPVDNQAWKMLSQASVIHRTFGDSVTTDITVFSIGKVSFATHPGETSPWLGLKTRELLPPGTKFVMGLSQDALGYILKPAFFFDTTFRHSQYLTSMSLGERTTPLILNKLQELTRADER